jgi:predicted Zn-dependent protease
MHHSPFKIAVALALALFLTVSAGCSGPAGRQARMLKQVKSLIEGGDYSQAGEKLEKVLSQNPKHAEACFLAGQVELHYRHTQRAYEWFSKALQLDPDLWDARTELARLLLAAGKLEQAKTHIDFILEHQPLKIDAQLMNCSILIGQQHYEEAEKSINGLIGQGVTQPELYLLLATARSRQNDPEGSEKALLAGIKVNPAAASLQLFLAHAYIQSKQTDKAAAALKQVMALEPQNISHPLALANLYLDAGRKDEAEAILKTYLGTDAQKSDRRLALAQFYLNRKDTEKAEKILKEGIAQLPASYPLQQGLARIYLATQRREQAVALLQSYLEQKELENPEDIQTARLALAGIYLEQRSLDQAAALVQEVLKQDTNQVDANFLQGRIYLLKGQGDPAAAAFTTVLAQKPGYIDGYIHLADAYLLKKDFEAAVAALQKGLRVAPDAKLLHVALAKVQLDRKDYKAAEAEFLEILKIDPGDYRIQAQLGDFYLALKDTARAQREYAEIVNKYPTNETGYIRLSRLYRSQGKSEAAIAELEKGFANNFKSKALAGDLVDAYLSANRADRAIALCQDLLKRNPEEAFTHNLMGVIHYHQKHYEQAEKAFQKAMELDPQWPDPSNKLAGLYLVQGKKAAAVRDLESALTQNSKNPAAYMTLARIYEKDRDYNKAAEVYDRALKALPDFWRAANSLAFLLCDHQHTDANLERALKLASGAYRLQPGNASILDTLGWIYYRKDNYQQALTIFKELSRQLPENELVNYHLAMVLFKSGQKEEARTKLELCLKTNKAFPGREEAEKTLNTLKARG